MSRLKQIMDTLQAMPFFGILFQKNIKMIKIFRIILVLFFIGQGISSIGQSSLQAAIDHFVDDPLLVHSSIGIVVLDIQSGKIIAQYDKNRGLMPASILKIVTTSSALGLLGGDYRFKTELNYTGSIDREGTLNGNLFLTGFGDPSLGSERWEGLDAVMKEFTGAILKKGIKCIEGSIIGDGSYFDTAAAPEGWQWQDLGNYYGAGVWGLNLNENLYHITFAQSNTMGGKPRITGIRPEISNLSFVNELTSGARGSGDNAYIFGAPYNSTRFIRGTIPRGTGTFSIKGSIPDGPLFAAQTLAAKLDEAGLTGNKGVFSDLTYPGKIPDHSSRKILYTHHSLPLREIVDITNHKSINLYCEAMLKTIGAKKNKQGNIQKGITQVESYWQERGLSFEGIHLVDGSGLSRTNIVTANFMAQLLRKISLNKSIYKDFYHSLSIAGKTGYVQSILKNTRAEGNLRAKTGTMESVRSFAGYATMKNGKKVSFCIIVNNFEGTGRDIRQKCAKIMKAICN